MDLNAEQERVATFRDGRIAVLAGPGSGKTRVLVERIRRLIRAGTDPDGIVALTFTIRAAAELEERLAGVTKKGSLGFAGTIHSYAHWMLTSYPNAQGALGSHFTVLDENDRQDILRWLHGLLGLRARLSRLVRLIDDHREILDPEAPIPPSDKEHLEAERLRQAYRNHKSTIRAEDFDGLVQRARLVMLQNPLAASDAHGSVHHLCIDEAQDLDGAQADFLELVLPPATAIPVQGTDRSLLMVGDPMQSIYGWRGGDPRYLVDFSKDAHEVVHLSRNYRSARLIVEVCNAIAADPTICTPELRETGVDYAMTAHRQEPGAVEGLVVRAVPPLNDAELIEADAVAGEIAHLAHAGAWRSCAILARTNRALERFDRALRGLGIPTVRLGANRERLEEPVCRDAIAWLRAVANPSDDRAHYKVFGFACSGEGIGNNLLDRMEDMRQGRTVRAMTNDGSRLYDEIRANPTERAHLEAKRRILAGLINPGPAGWGVAVDEAWGYCETRLRLMGLTTAAEHIAWMRTLIEPFMTGRVPGSRGRLMNTLPGFLWWLLFGQGAGEHDPKRDAVTLSTIHLAKGLEWPNVWIPAMNEGHFPSAMALRGGPQGLAEEGRVWFVAASRAADSLIVLSPRTHTLPWKDEPEPAQESRFFAHLAAADRAR